MSTYQDDRRMDPSEHKARADRYTDNARELADGILISIRHGDIEDQNELEAHLQNTLDLEPWILDPELQIDTLRYSPYARAGFFNSTYKAECHETRNPKEGEFPFQAFAYDALEAHIKELLMEKFDVNDWRWLDDGEEEADEEEDQEA